jgi:serine/threonine-protein kinase
VADLPRPFGSYVLLKALGTGGTGDVFLARPQDQSRNVPSPVVIKRLHGQLAEQDDFVKRFQHEAKIAVAISSPHIARVFDVGRVDDTFYIAMEYVAGWTIARIIQDLKDAGGQATLSSVVDVIRGALLGLSALHTAKDPETGQALGTIHRDIAPKNLMLGEDGVTRLIDLGLGKSSIQDWRTSTGVVMGSPGYMAPEQVVAEGVDQRCDLYSVGIVLWEFLTLKRYIKRGPVPIMLRAQVSPTFRPPSESRPDVPRALDEICRKALEIDPGRRFQTAAELIAALDATIEPREEEAPLATIVGDMLWGELGQSKTEVTKLLSVVASAPGPAVSSVEVFAERSEPIERVAAFDPSSGPSRIDTPSDVLVRPVRGDAPTPTPIQYATPLQNSYFPPPAEKGVPVKAVVLLMVLTLGVGLGGGALLLRSSAEPSVVRSVEVRPPPIVAKTEPPVAIVAPKQDPVPPEPKPSFSPTDGKTGAKATPKQKAKVATAPPPPPEVDPPGGADRSDKDRLTAVIQRARSLAKRVAGTDREAAVNSLINKASTEIGASEINPATVRTIEQQLADLEK